MHQKIDIRQVLAARDAFFPDGGQREIHRVRHRSFLRRLRDRLRVDRFTLTLLLVVSLVASAATVAIVGAPFTRSGMALAVDALRGERSDETRDLLRREYEELSTEDRSFVREMIGK